MTRIEELVVVPATPALDEPLLPVFEAPLFRSANVIVPGSPSSSVMPVMVAVG